MAERFWPGENPIGQRVREARTLDTLGPSIEICRRGPQDSKYVTVGEKAPGSSCTGRYPSATRLQLRSCSARMEPLRCWRPPVRAAIATVEPDLPLFNVSPLAELTELSLLPLQLATYVSGLLGSPALALAVIGLYGVVSHLVRLRRREIAIRIALGALPSQVVRMVTRQGLRWIAIGLAVWPDHLDGLRTASGGAALRREASGPPGPRRRHGAAGGHRLPVMSLAGPANQPPRSHNCLAGAVGGDEDLRTKDRRLHEAESALAPSPKSFAIASVIRCASASARRPCSPVDHRRAARSDRVDEVRELALERLLVRNGHFAALDHRHGRRRPSPAATSRLFCAA